MKKPALDLSKPCVMGILNLTPDSFTEVGRVQSVEAALRHAEQMIAEGAALIDVGAEPTNPSCHPCVSLQEEMDRLMPVLEQLCQHCTVPISVDTSKPEIMREAIRCGATMINDVRALQREGAMETVANSEAMVCLMHMAFPEGKPESVEHKDFQPDVVTVVCDYLQQRIEACLAAGIDKSRLMVDPGLGSGNFGKTTIDNLQLLRALHRFTFLDVPILIGASRKTFIGDILDKPVEQRLFGSVAVAVMAVNNGATIIRAHDVAATVEALKLVTALHQGE